MTKSFNLKRKSLFVKLLLGFTLLIVISLIYNLISYHFFHNRMTEQLVHSNTMSLFNRADQIEKQFLQIDNLLTMYFFDTSLVSLEKSNFDTSFPTVNNMAQRLKLITSNYNTSIENALIYYVDQGFVIDKNGYNSIEDMFDNYYINEQYNNDFWASVAVQDDTFHLKVLPAASFQHSSLGSLQKDLKAKNYLPVVVRNQIGSPFIMIALIDADRLFGDLFNLDEREGFYIADESGEIYYKLGQIQEQEPSVLTSDQSYRLYDNHYYFYHKGAISGLTYVTIMPYGTIQSKLNQLSFLLILLFGLSLVISIIFSVLMSIRLKHPVQRIIDGLREMNPDFTHRSKVHEFNVISEGLQQIISSMQRKDTLLHKYSYLEKIKSIQMIDSEYHKLVDSSKPFHLIIFQFHTNPDFILTKQESIIKPNSFLELVNKKTSEAFADSLTMQIEKNRILSIVFTECDISPVILELLEGLKGYCDRDLYYYQTVVVFQQRLWEPTQFNLAYESLIEMTRQRNLQRGTQLITNPGSGPVLAFWTPDNEKNFISYLDVGSFDSLEILLQNRLRWLAKHQASAWHYQQFAKNLLSKLLMALVSHKIDTGLLHSADALSPFEVLEGFLEVKQYEEYLNQITNQAAALIREKHSERDPIVDFVIDFIEKHYGDDIYQDLIATRLNISSGYLRSYFKDKTGQNLKDYLNEVRMEKAKQLLQETEERIQVIAAKVGYPNANSFSRMFRRLTGVTPGEFRREHRIAN